MVVDAKRSLVEWFGAPARRRAHRKKEASMDIIIKLSRPLLPSLHAAGVHSGSAVEMRWNVRVVFEWVFGFLS